MNYIYNIKNKLSKNVNELNINKNTKVFLCIYEVLYKINSTMENPFLQYLMYKYQKSDNVDELLMFPFFKYNSGNVLETAKSIVNNLSENVNFEGYLIFEEQIYLFFGGINMDYNFKKIQSNNKFWWCLIDEICNKKKLINYKFHENVVKLFLSNEEMIYLYDNSNKKLEIPIAAYRGDHIDILKYLAAFGQRRSTRSRFGPFYTSGTFNWAIRWAGWSKNYQKHNFMGKNITDDNGKYLKGGVIRYAIFLGNLEECYVIINNKKNYFDYLINHWDLNKNRSKSEINAYTERVGKETGKWAIHYKSVIVPKIKYNKNDGYFNINTEFIISNSNNKITLSVHELDMTSLKENWDPLYENYSIL
jgi:hypothetical protein